MSKILLTISVSIILAFTACSGSKPSAGNNNSANSANKTETTETKKTETTASTAGSPTSVVKEIYDHAIKRNCAAIPPMLTEDFRKAVGTSKDELEALCDTFTDSSKVTSVEVKGETVNGELAKVKVALTYKDGKKEDKEENVKKSGGKWLMDS